jgi:hypothetical protein
MRGRKPGSLHSADSGRDDTKKDSGRDDAERNGMRGDPQNLTASSLCNEAVPSVKERPSYRNGPYWTNLVQGGVSGGQGHREHSGRGLYVA